MSSTIFHHNNLIKRTNILQKQHFFVVPWCVGIGSFYCIRSIESIIANVAMSTVSIFLLVTVVEINWFEFDFVRNRNP